LLYATILINLHTYIPPSTELTLIK